MRLDFKYIHTASSIEVQSHSVITQQRFTPALNSNVRLNAESMRQDRQIYLVVEKPFENSGPAI